VIGFRLYPEGGITESLRSGSRKSCEGEIAVFRRAHEPPDMKTNDSRRESEEQLLQLRSTDTGLAPRMEEDCAISGRMVATDDSLSTPVAAVPARRPFPLRTLMVCFTVWLITTEVLILDQVKFNAKTELLKEAAQGLGGPQIVIPTERSSDVPSGARMERL
jgi:hypothetical protein